MRFRRFVCLASIAALPAFAAPAQPVEARLRHDLAPDAAAALAALATRFNDEESAGKRPGRILLEPVAEKSTAVPALLLMGDEDGARARAGRRLRPLHQFLAENGQRIDLSGLYPALRDAVDDAGRVQALPLAMSLPVLLWNRDAFQRAGLDPAQPPRTWWELQTAAGRLYDAGWSCPYTSSWPVWVHLENVSAQHGEPFASGLRGSTRLSFNSLVHVKHVALLSSWFKSRYFHLFGDQDEADGKFAAARCGMLTSTSAAAAALRRSASFAVGVAELPYYDDVRGAVPANVVPGGSSLWAVAGARRPEAQAAARFVAFLMRPQQQREWSEATGFLPMTPAAGGNVPGLDQPAARVLAPRLTERKVLAGLRGRPGNAYDEVRAILRSELGAVWADRKPAKEALDNAARLGNNALAGRVARPERP